MRKRCVVCNKLTENWQRVNGGPWHCFDGCKSTTGVDYRALEKAPNVKVQKFNRSQLGEYVTTYWALFESGEFGNFNFVKKFIDEKSAVKALKKHKCHFPSPFGFKKENDSVYSNGNARLVKQTATINEINKSIEKHHEDLRFLCSLKRSFNENIGRACEIDDDYIPYTQQVRP